MVKPEATPAKKSKSKKRKKKSEKKIDKVVIAEDSNEKIELSPENKKLQEEHARLMKKGKALGVKFHKAEEEDLLHEICDKHLGKGKLFTKATVIDIEKME